MKALKPCPFCGGEAEKLDLEDDEFGNGGGSCISCKRCEACSQVHFDRKENLEDSWNRRHTVYVKEARTIVPAAAAKVVRTLADRAHSWADEHIDALNDLCEKFGCEPGSNRLEWLDAQLSQVPLPPEKTFDVWAAVGADKELDRARSRLSMHEFRLIFRHAWANPPSPVADKEKLQALIDSMWPKDEAL